MEPGLKLGEVVFAFFYFANSYPFGALSPLEMKMTMKEKPARRMDSLEAIRERVDGYQTQEESTARIHELLGQEVLNYYELGALLSRHKLKNWITPQLDPNGHPKSNAFECWVQIDLRMDLSRATRLMSLFDAITENGLTEDSLAGVGWSAMVTIKPVLTKRAASTGDKRKKAADIQKLLELARVKTVSLLKVEVDKMLGRGVLNKVAATLDERSSDPLASIRTALDVVLGVLEARTKEGTSNEMRPVGRLAVICDHLGKHYQGVRFVFLARDEDGNHAGTNFSPEDDRQWFFEELRELEASTEITAEVEIPAPVEGQLTS